MPERGPIMQRLVERGVPLRIYGLRWSKAPEYTVLEPHISGGPMVGDDYAKALQGAQIAIGLLSKGNEDLHTTRSLEIPAMGVLLCAERTSDHLAMYEDGRRGGCSGTTRMSAPTGAWNCWPTPDRIARIAAAGHRRVPEEQGLQRTADGKRPFAKAWRRRGGFPDQAMTEPNLYDSYSTFMRWGDTVVVDRPEDFEQLLREAGLGGRTLSILDFGFGAGAFMDWAKAAGHAVTGIEILPEMIAAATARGHRAVQADQVDAQLADGAFDAIVALDVLEHLDRSGFSALMALARRTLKPEGPAGGPVSQWRQPGLWPLPLRRPDSRTSPLLRSHTAALPDGGDAAGKGVQPPLGPARV